jgi:hypothetical protein
MNVLLWVLQVALAFLYLAGGSYKAFKFDALANQHARWRWKPWPSPGCTRGIR